MARHRHDRNALFPNQQEPPEEQGDVPLDSTAEVTTEPAPESIEIPVYPASIQLTKIIEDWAILRGADIKVSAMFSLDRHQLIELGSAMLKCGQSMPSPKQIEKAAKRAGETVRDSGLVVPT